MDVIVAPTPAVNGQFAASVRFEDVGSSESNSLRQMLAEQFRNLQQLLSANHDRAQGLAGKQEAELNRLQGEIQQLQRYRAFAPGDDGADRYEYDRQLMSVTTLSCDDTVPVTPYPPTKPVIKRPEGSAPSIPMSPHFAAWNADANVQMSDASPRTNSQQKSVVLQDPDPKPLTAVVPMDPSSNIIDAQADEARTPRAVSGVNADRRFSPPPLLNTVPSQAATEASIGQFSSGSEGIESETFQVGKGPRKQGTSTGTNYASTYKETFDVLPTWRVRKGFEASGQYSSVLVTQDPSGMSGMSQAGGVCALDSNNENTDSTDTPRVGRDQYTDRCHIIHPSGGRRAVWDLSSLSLVCYDMVVLPLQFFNPAETDFDVFMAWVTRIFWTMDLGLSFFTGYVTSDGFIELRPKKIVKRYLTTWLVLDMLIVGVDWLEILMQATGGLGFARIGKASRTFRIIRMLRLLRLARMREVIQIIIERINSEKVVLVAGILKLMSFLIASAHLFACLWYAVGDGKRNEPNWIDEFNYRNKDLGSKYAMSMHWAVTQFSGGMDEITPENPRERVFAIAIFLFGFIGAALFVSSITSSMTQLTIIGSHQSQQLSSLRRYLHQNGISNKLAVRVQRNAKFAATELARSVPENQVVLLGMVSEPLRVEIHLEMYAPILMVHPFFSTYIETCPQVMRKVCHSATSIMMLSGGDVVFSAGEIPSQPKMYIIVSGFAEYKRGQYTKEGDCVCQDQWLSEASLWTHWMHRGTLMAQSDVRFCVLDAHKFQDIAGQFTHGEFDPRDYAEQFVQLLNTGHEVSDLPFEYDSTVACDMKVAADAYVSPGETIVGYFWTQWQKFREGKQARRNRVTKIMQSGPQSLQSGKTKCVGVDSARVDQVVDSTRVDQVAP